MAAFKIDDHTTGYVEVAGSENPNDDDNNSAFRAGIESAVIDNLKLKADYQRIDDQFRSFTNSDLNPTKNQQRLHLGGDYQLTENQKAIASFVNIRGLEENGQFNRYDGIRDEKIYLVGHSWGADIAMHFTILYPEKVEKLVAIEPNIAALIDWRKSKDWEGWTYWAKRLEEFDIHVPRDKWHDADYMLRQTVNLPLLYGPFKGRPRRNNTIIKLLDTTTLMKDYEKVAGMTLDKVENISRPMLAVYGDQSHFLLTYDLKKYCKM